MTTAIHLERETWDRAVEVSDGFWVIATHHRPGFFKMSPVVNNRCLVFRLQDSTTGKPVLLVANAVDPVAMPEVRRIERETGVPVRYLLSPGGGHHVLLPGWRDEFTEASVLVGPERIPRTPSAAKLMAGGRVTVMAKDDPLPQFRGQLDAVLFHGINGVRDHATPAEGGKEPGMFGMMKMMMNVDDPTDEVWLRHTATDTVIAGDNLMWILSKQTVSSFPFMFRMMMKPDTVAVQDQARKVADAAKVAACWGRILEWPAQTLLGYHEPPGEAFRGDGRAALRQAAIKGKQIPAV